MDVLMMRGLFEPSNEAEHRRALGELQQLKDTKDGWKVCASTLANEGVQLDDKVKFLCLQVLAHYTKDSYLQASVEDQNLLRQYLSQWISALCTATPADKIFIHNKTAQVFTHMFLVDYVDRWPSFMSDMLATLPCGPNSVDLYLKILLAIDAELVDRDTIHSEEDQKRNTLLKDTMRERCVVDMANSWFEIMIKYESSHPEIVCHCHDIIGAYISWIDIGLIVNDRFVHILISHLKNPLLREAAADCVHEIFSKGMEPPSKVQLIEFLNSILEQADILKPIDDDDSDFLVKLSRLVNCMGVQLIMAYHKLDKNDVENGKKVRLIIESKVTLMMQFMASDFDDVSAAVFDFARDYIQLIKSTGQLTGVERGQLENMLYVIISKTKYEENFKFENQGEDEAMFDEYRKKLRIVFDNLAALVPDLVLEVCKDYVGTTLNRWQPLPFEDVEAAISLLHSIGEALPVSHGNHFTGPNETRTSTMMDLMRRLVQSGVCRHSHPAVTFQYFECVTRYEKFFAIQPQCIPDVLHSFLNECGLRNPSMKVRSRVAYLFSRFVRCLKAQLLVYTDEILTQVAELLTIGPYENGQAQPLLCHDDQLYIYEAVSLLIIGGSSQPEQKALRMRNVLTPLLNKVTSLAERLAGEPNSHKQAQIAKSIIHIASVTARTSKAFSSQNSMKNCHCVPLYLEALQLFFSCITVGKEREELCDGVRPLIHRLVVCLESSDIAPVLPAASQLLLQIPTPTALTEYLNLINQIITKFKKEIVTFLQEIFSPLVNTIFVALSQPVDQDDIEEKRSRRTLQRNYFLFLITITNADLYEVLQSQSHITLRQVLESVVQSSVEFEDPIGQKYCFVFLRKLIDKWANATEGPPQFLEFIYQRIIPACFMAPLKCTFDLNDAQSIIALHESSMCLKSVFNARGDELTTYLKSQYFIKMDLTPHLATEFCHALAADGKLFRNYTKLFFKNIRS